MFSDSALETSYDALICHGWLTTEINLFREKLLSMMLSSWVLHYEIFIPCWINCKRLSNLMIEKRECFHLNINWCLIVHAFARVRTYEALGWAIRSAGFCWSSGYEYLLSLYVQMCFQSLFCSIWLIFLQLHFMMWCVCWIFQEIQR